MSTQLHDGGQSAVPYQRRIVLLQIVTVSWMCAEAGIAISAAIRAHSVALWGFGADSGIELVSAFVVLLRFKKRAYVNERAAARITGMLLFALAAFIIANSILAFTNARLQPEPTYVGIALLIAAGVFMPWLAHQKKSLAVTTGSGSLKADATQSSMCAYLAWTALGGLTFNAFFKLPWADPVAALLLVPIVVREGWEAMHGKPCADCSC